jgi:large subunit ribosomal protein L4
LGIQNVLIIIDGPEEALEKAARNVPRVQVTRWEGLNVYDILRHEYVVFLRSSLERLERNLRP